MGSIFDSFRCWQSVGFVDHLLLILLVLLLCCDPSQQGAASLTRGSSSTGAEYLELGRACNADTLQLDLVLDFEKVHTESVEQVALMHVGDERVVIAPSLRIDCEACSIVINRELDSWEPWLGEFQSGPFKIRNHILQQQIFSKLTAPRARVRKLELSPSLDVLVVESGQHERRGSSTKASLHMSRDRARRKASKVLHPILAFGLGLVVPLVEASKLGLECGRALRLDEETSLSHVNDTKLHLVNSSQRLCKATNNVPP